MLPALFAAGLWGATDAFAGISARRSTPLLAALWLHVASLAVLAPFVAGVAAISLEAALFGALAGIIAALGDVLFGRALSISAMSVGIPLANVIAAAIIRPKDEDDPWRHNVFNIGAEMSMLVLTLNRVGDPQKLQDMLRVSNNKASRAAADLEKLRARNQELQAEVRRLRHPDEPMIARRRQVAAAA